MTAAAVRELESVEQEQLDEEKGQGEMMATARRKQLPTSVRIEQEDKKLLDEVKAAIAPGATFSKFLRDLAEEKLSPELVAGAERTRAILSADELDIDISAELAPVVARLDKLEKLETNRANPAGGFVRHKDFPLNLYSIGLLIADPADGQMVYALKKGWARGVDAERGAWATIHWAFSETILTEKDGSLPRVIAGAIRAEAQQAAEKKGGR